MVNAHCRGEHIRCMSVLADIAGLDVCRALARGLDAIVAIDAISRDVHMIEVRGQPAACRMTVVASIAAGDVVRVFPRCCKAVMAAAAGAHYLDVVDGVDRRKRVGVVAIFADIGRRNMCRVLADGIRAVVAARATVDDVRVIEVRRRPANCRVTVVAGIAGGQVCRVLAYCGNAIMAGAAGTDHLSMVHGEYGCEHVRRMAVLADIAGLNVR